MIELRSRPKIIMDYLLAEGPKTLAQITLRTGIPKKEAEKAIYSAVKSGRALSFEDSNPLYEDGVKFQRPICRFFTIAPVRVPTVKKAWQPKGDVSIFAPKRGKLDRMLRRSEVESVTGLSKTTIYEGMAAGTFPRSTRIGVKAVAWPESVIKAWLAEKINGEKL